MQSFYIGQILQFYYTNHRGERSLRTAVVQGIDYGSNEWYPEPTWFLRTWDRDKNDFRSFAFNKIEAETIQKINRSSNQRN